MKTQTSNTVIPYYILVLILVTTACRTKHLEKQMTRTSERQAEATSIKRRQDELLQGNRIISMSDSGNHQYRVTIFPLDTFSFSIKNGFKGKASSIEVLGTEHHVKQSVDRTAFTAKKENDLQYDQESKSRETATSSTKASDKSRASMSGVFMWIALSGLIGWLVWMGRNRRIKVE